MNVPTNVILGLAVLACLVLFVYIVYQFFVYLKRAMRKSELRHQVNLIRDPYGYSEALETYDRCIHLSYHYHIPFEEVGVTGGQEGLFKEALSSAQAAEKRKREVLTKENARV